MVNIDQISFKNQFVCGKCDRFLFFNDDIFMLYFQSKEIRCSNCDVKVDIYKAFKNLLDMGAAGFHYSLIGCIGKVKKFNIKANETYMLDLSNEIGGGELLYINYTPTGKGHVHPLEMHFNIPPRTIWQNSVKLYGLPLAVDASESEITCFYWFAPAELKEDLGMGLILDAFQRYYENNYRYMVISAFTAVEISQYNFFAELLKSSGLSYSKKIEPFLTHNATFSSQLRVLLPFLADEMKIPMLNKPIYEGLENLRKDRNDVVHKGEPKEGWDHEKVKTELISALFAYKYYKLMLPKINKGD
ncbi:MAG: hypothetical protein ACC609_11225 [Methanobacterium formicicum]